MATNPLLYPALVETALITYRGVINKSNVNNPIPHFPLPSQVGSVVFVYGTLSLFPDSANRLATLLGWGFVVATALNVWSPGGKVTNTNAVVASNATAGSELIQGTTSSTNG
jgi:hypothetical protein